MRQIQTQPRTYTQGTFGNESTLVDIVATWFRFIAQILGNKMTNFEGGNIIY